MESPSLHLQRVASPKRPRLITGAAAILRFPARQSAIHDLDAVFLVALDAQEHPGRHAKIIIYRHKVRSSGPRQPGVYAELPAVRVAVVQHLGVEQVRGERCLATVQAIPDRQQQVGLVEGVVALEGALDDDTLHAGPSYGLGQNSTKADGNGAPEVASPNLIRPLIK